MSAHVRARGRHRRPRPDRTVRTAVAVGGLTATAVIATEAVTGGAFAATADDFARLRACESGGNYATNTGNGYYGAYQFDLGTWHGLGYSGLPSDASAATQDAAARRLQASRGWSPWPACSASLGLGSSTSPSTSSVTTVTTATTTAAPVVINGPGPYRGVVLSTEYKDSKRSDVRKLQKQLLTAGYVVTVDGRYGKQTERVVKQFQRDAGITRDGLAGPETFGALY
jgi:peptidoglycan hydrolase-like protein with peptidoglycan-binding domain